MRSRLTMMIGLAVLMAYPAFSQGDRKAGIPGSTKTKGKGMSSEQAEAILSELKGIRQLLERQQTAHVAAPNILPSVPEKIQMAVGAGWHSIGKDDAPVTLVEFADFQCPYCRKFHAETFSELKKNYIETGKVRFISRDFPLDFHAYSMKAAEASHCAGDQGKYWEMRDALITNSAVLNDELIAKLAESKAVSMEDFQSCISSHRHQPEIEKDTTEAAAIHISGTPSFVLAKSSKDKLDGVKLVGALPYGQFKSAIDELLKN